MELDHVLIAVADLDAAGRDLEQRYGLSSLVGGRHPGWGTGNRIVPLGDAYLELVAMLDSAEAAQAPFGRWVGSMVGSTPTPFAWCVRTANLDGVAARLGLEPAAGSRETPDGSVLRWRIAGLEQAAAEPCLPFFIERAEIDHPAGAPRLERLELSGDPGRVDEWLGGAPLPVSVSPREPAITAVVVRVEADEFAVA
jgi:hypothetical protein